MNTARTRIICVDDERQVVDAIAAVNSGQLFRFLTKPCAKADLQAAITAAVAHHRLITAERVLLERTLHGSVAALVDILAMTNAARSGARPA